MGEFTTVYVFGIKTAYWCFKFTVFDFSNQSIQFSEFKAKCLALIDKIAASGEKLMVSNKRETYRGDEALLRETRNLAIRSSTGFGNPWRLTCPYRSGGS